MMFDSQEKLYSFPPICDSESRILILGTMPSPASFKAQMYYSHPRNSFWSVMSALFDEKIGSEAQRKKDFLLCHNIALWDTLKCCVRETASDNDIKEVEPNDIGFLLSQCPQIKAVFLNGGGAYKYYKKYYAQCIPYFQLPSTSPANQSLNFEDKLEKWRLILDYLMM